MVSAIGYAQVGPKLRVREEKVDEDDTNCVTSL
jgi:hypothetical protein